MVTLATYAFKIPRRRVAGFVVSVPFPDQVLLFLGVVLVKRAHNAGQTCQTWSSNRFEAPFRGKSGV